LVIFFTRKIKSNSNQGRDFFDLVFLMGKNIIPNMAYLEQKIGIITTEELTILLLDKCNTLNMDEMTRDVAPFLFSENDQKRIKFFKDYLEGFSFNK